MNGDELFSNTHVTASGQKFLTSVGNTNVSNVTTTYAVTVASGQQRDGTTGKPTGSSATSAKSLHDKTDLTTWHHAELKPDDMAEANNIYSAKFHLSGRAGSGFEINDINVVFRMKNIK